MDTEKIAKTTAAENNNSEISHMKYEELTDELKKIFVAKDEPKQQHSFYAAKLKELMVQNVKKTRSKSFTQYTKDMIKQYIQNPYSNIDTIRQVSAFLERSSMIYKKILEYFSCMPLFYYNLINKVDFSKGVDKNILKTYNDVLIKLQEINMKKEFSQIIATTLRDGIYCGFIYDGEGDGFFIQALDPQYCKVESVDAYGQYVISFNANYFKQGNNSEFVSGINGDTEGIWDDVFVQGYNAFDTGGRDFQWFTLPPEKTICIIAGDDPTMPLPYFLPVFTSLLDLLDLEQILASKTELENYVLLLNKIPMVPNSDGVDDFAVSDEVIEATQAMIDEVVPDLVGTAYTPCEMEVVHFDKANTSEDTDRLAQSMHNLFSNTGISELVVSSGSSTNSVGLSHSIKNDESFAFKYLFRLEAWMNAYIKHNYSEDFIFKFHPVSYFSKDEYIQQQKDAATLGLPVKTSYATSLGMTPYEMICQTYFENALDLQSLWQPLESSYMQSGTEDSQPGAPTKDDADLSDEGLKTRDGEKNAGTKANK